MDINLKLGVPFKDIPGTTVVANEVSDGRVRIAGHPLPWKFVSKTYSDAVDDADGNEVTHFLAEEQGKLFGAIVDFLNRYHGDDWFVRATEAANAGYVSREEASALWGLEPGAVHVLDDAGEREIQRIAEEVSPEELERMISEIELGPFPMETPIVPDPRIADLEAALVEIAEVYSGPARYEQHKKCRDILHRVGLADRLPGNPDKAEEVVY